MDHPLHQCPGHKQCHGNANKRKHSKRSIVVDDDGKGADKFKGIYNQAGDPVQDAIGDIGGIGIPAGQQVSSMVGGDGFPVRHQHFRKHIGFDLVIHPYTDPVGDVAGKLVHHSTTQRQADHGAKSL